MKTLSIKTFTILLTTCLGLTVLNSCQKEKVTTPPTTTTTPPSAAPSISSFNYVNQALVDGLTAVFSSNKNSFKTQSIAQAFSSCATVTEDTSVIPYKKTFNFGTGCTSNGSTRSGTIVVTYNSNNFKQGGDTALINFNTYTWDSLQYAGSLTAISYVDSSGYVNFTYTLNLNITVNGTTYPYSGDLNWQWIAGMNSSPASNIQFSITGNISGYDNNHVTEVVNITSPLLLNFDNTNASCNNYWQGTVVITNNGNAPAATTVDFGSGTCTGMESVTQYGKTTTQPQ